MPQAVVAKVIDGQFRLFQTVAPHFGDVVIRLAEQFDARQFRTPERLGLPEVEGSRNDAVAFPFFQPLRRHGIQCAVLVADGPRSVLRGITADALDHSAAERPGRLHQQQHVRNPPPSVRRRGFSFSRSVHRRARAAIGKGGKRLSNKCTILANIVQFVLL